MTADKSQKQATLGQSDDKVRKNTGKDWRAWLRILDSWGAKERKHGEVAAYLQREHGVPGWWAQTITTGFERARGIRAKHQSLTGTFQVSVSKTFPIGTGVLFTAFTEARQRARWLERGTLKVRTTMKNRSARFDFGDGTSRVVAYFDPKERRKTTVTIMHELLPSAASVEQMRAMWKEHLDRLKEVLVH